MESLNMEIIITLKDRIFDIAHEIKEYSNELFNKLMGVHDELENLLIINDDPFDWPMTKEDFCKEFACHKSTFAEHVKNLKLTERDLANIEEVGKRKLRGR